MNQLTVPTGFGVPSTKFASEKSNNALGAGIAASFGIISIKGKVFKTRYKGAETLHLRPDGTASGFIDVVIVDASPAVSKIYYGNGYQEGSKQAPDCFSSNGLTPDVGARAKQSASCAACDHNKWGARITPAGKPGKNCSDSRRIAVVPAGNIDNPELGGPMLLRVPAASLRDLAEYGSRMDRMGYPFFAVATRISFDPNEAYQKLVFQELRSLDDTEADKIVAWRQSPEVERILSADEHATEAVAAPAETEKPNFIQQATPAPAPAPGSVPVALVADPVTTEAAPKSFDQTLDDELASLMGDA